MPLRLACSGICPARRPNRLEPAEKRSGPRAGERRRPSERPGWVRSRPAAAKLRQCPQADLRTSAKSQKAPKRRDGAHPPSYTKPASKIARTDQAFNRAQRGPRESAVGPARRRPTVAQVRKCPWPQTLALAMKLQTETRRSPSPPELPEVRCAPTQCIALDKPVIVHGAAKCSSTRIALSTERLNQTLIKRALREA